MRKFHLPLLALILICGMAARFELAEVSLVSPADDAGSVPVAPTFSWNPVDGSESYELEVATKRNMRQPVIAMSSIAGTSTLPADLLDENTTYYWRARAVDSQGPGPWSSVWAFKTGNLPGTASLLQPANQSLGIDLTPEFSWSNASGAESYDLEVSTSPQFTSLSFTVPNIGGTQYEPSSNLEVQTLYYWRVRASNSIGYGDFSNISWFETVTASPSQVALSFPADGATGVETGLTFSWAAADAAESYRLEVSSTPGFTTKLIDESGIANPSYSVGNPLTNGEMLYWRVRATNSLGDGPVSEVFSFTTETGGPTQVSLISPADGSEDVPLTPSLVWQSVDGATNYRVQVGTQADFSGSLLFDTVVGGTQFQANLSLGGTYFWRVRASNAGVENWSDTFSLSTGSSAPAQVVLVSPAAGASDQSLSLDLVWAATDFAESYNLQVGLDAGFTTLVLNEADLQETSFSLEDLSHSTQYYWRVQAINSAGDGPWSAGRSFMTEIVLAPSTPLLIYPPNGADGIVSNPVMSWNASDGATSYKLEISTSPPDELENFITVVTAVVVAQPYFQAPDLQGGKLHYWRVEARNEGGSARSEVRTFSTAAVTANESDELPAHFDLEQNYPNPFNSTTTLSYELPEAADVRLVVFDMLGRTVEALVTVRQSAGRHSVVWDAANHTSGIYYYRIEAGDFASTKRMLLTR